MSMPAVHVHLPRYPNAPACSWSDGGKCRNCDCRYSLLAERPRIREWAREDLEELIDAMPATCALDLASQGPMLLDEIATLLGIPRSFVEQFEAQGLRKLARDRDVRRAHWDER
jgi:hypothetical protein